MQIRKLINQIKKPEIYTKGNSFMWTDKYISKQLLQIHLNKDIDLASRNETSIERTIEWILSKSEKEGLKILDLGCGPGLYSSKLATHGHEVTGIDISHESINYARMTAQDNKNTISYKNGNYLDIDLGNSEFDLIIMIYTDFGVLSPEERMLLLDKIRKALKPKGRFIFDILNYSSFSDKTPEKIWEFEKEGFWSKTPYLHLSNAYVFSVEKVILYQHFVLNESDDIKSYNFWTHFFSHMDIINILDTSNFKVIELNEDVLQENNQWSGKNVTFVEASLKAVLN